MRRFTPVGSSRNAGITILEVMVGLGIVMALVVALMPVLARARDVSYTARCLHNLKQLGVGFGQYDQDNLGYLPHAQYAGFNGATGAPTGASVTDLQSREWMRLYYPYILSTPISPSELSNPYASPNMVAIRDQTSVFDCPATNIKVGHFHPINSYKSYPKLFDYLVFTHVRPGGGGVLINKLQQLSTKDFLLMDARDGDPIYTWGNNFDSGNDNYFLWQLLYFPSSPTVDGATGYRPGYHHQVGTNTLFPDGAAQHLTRSDVQPNWTSGNYTTRISLP